MGIELSMWQISPSDLDRLLDSEDSVEEFIDSRFPSYSDKENDVDDFGSNESELAYEGLYLDKGWHLLNYLITGDVNGGDYPLAHAIMAGHLLHESWDTLVYSRADEVKDVAKALSDLSEEDLLKNCNNKSLIKAKIYRFPKGVNKRDLKEIMDDFHRLKKYYRNATKNGNAVLRFFH
jgi:hypothetical protein